MLFPVPVFGPPLPFVLPSPEESGEGLGGRLKKMKFFSCFLVLGRWPGSGVYLPLSGNPGGGFVV